MNILSVSRRTDIPTYYSNWLRERLLGGSVDAYNPQCGGIVKISLKPEDVDMFVFWSRFYKPFLKECFPIIQDKRYKCQFHFTITGLPKIFEKNSPLIKDAVKSFKELAMKAAPHPVFWRFDPIVVTAMTPVKDIINTFKLIALQLEGYTNLCLVSFVKSYQNLLNRLPSPVIELNKEEKRDLLEKLVKIADGHNIYLRICQGEESIPQVVEAANCFEGGDVHSQVAGQSSYEKCSCHATIDIGSYDSCLTGCSYCFANADFEHSIARRRNHATSITGLPRPTRLIREQTPKLDPVLQGLHPILASCEICLDHCLLKKTNSQQKISSTISGPFLTLNV